MVIKYEKRNSGLKRICPFDIFGKRVVGSIRCQRCAYFVMIDKKEHTVNCSKKP